MYFKVRFIKKKGKFYNHNVDKIKIYPRVIEGNTNEVRNKIITYIKKHIISKKNVIFIWTESYVDVIKSKNSKGGRLQH